MIVDAYVYILWALMILILPLNWVIAILAAALIHEISHIFIVYILGGRVSRITIGISGALIETTSMTSWKILLASAAGPVGSLMLVLTYPRFPALALCGLCHGLYNLLPIFPMDGGRIMDALYSAIPVSDHIENRNKWNSIILIATICIIFLFAIALRFPGLMLILVPLLKEKYLAKKREKGYNKATIEMR